MCGGKDKKKKVGVENESKILNFLQNWFKCTDYIGLFEPPVGTKDFLPLLLPPMGW
jgi:hypothetical protein